MAELPAYTFKCNPAMTSHDITLNIEVKAHAGNATQNIHPLLDGEIRFISTKTYRKKSL